MSASPPHGPWDAPPPSGPPYGGGGAPGGPIPSYPGGKGAETQWGPSGQRELAGWWYRVGATLIDEIILGVVSGVLQLVLGRAAGDGIGIAINAVYLIGLVGGRGQTVGCMAVGIKVVAADGSARVGYGRAAVRWVMPWVFVILLVVPALLDVLWPLWDDQNQTLHDKVAQTLVVRAH